MTLLSLVSISKSFGSTIALDDVSFDVRGGEVHALLGENGAGKTTLVRIAYGLEPPDSGQVVVECDPSPRVNRERLASPREARALGIGMVHQHFTSIPALTVAENVSLAAGWRDTGRQAVRRVRALIDELRLPLDAAARAGDLSVQLRQRLEIVQALAADARVLLLDEPTAVLAPREVKELTSLIRRFADQGGAVVLITHKLREVAGSADRVTVLRDGRVIATGPADGFDQQALARAMIGDDIAARRDPRGTVTAPTIPVTRVTIGALALRGGEVVGIAAIEGNGERPLLRAIAGYDDPPAQTTVAVDGTVAFIPEDRTTEALIAEFSLVENLALGLIDQLPRWLDWQALSRQTNDLLTRYDVRAQGTTVAAAALSGGNQQKFVLGRALERRPEILVAMNPTRGLDIRATAAIHRRLREAANQGACVLVHSSDIDEVLDLADRVLVVCDGVVSEMPPGSSRTTVGDAMLGLTTPQQ